MKFLLLFFYLYPTDSDLIQVEERRRMYEKEIVRDDDKMIARGVVSGDVSVFIRSMMMIHDWFLPVRT